jgi:hypothetical protein
VNPQPATTASGWFRRFVQFIQAKNVERAIFLEGCNDFADLWANFEDVGLTARELTEMKQVLQSAKLTDQKVAWAVLEGNPSLFGLTATRFKWQLAQLDRFPAFEQWETLAPFRSVQDGSLEYLSVYAVAVEPTTSQAQGLAPQSVRGEVFRLAAVLAPSSGGKPTVEWSFEISDTATSEALRSEVRQLADQWLGFSCLALLWEYVFRGDSIFASLPRAVHLSLSASRIRKQLAKSDIYFVAGTSLRTPVTGQSMIAAALAALLLSLFRASGLPDLWMKVFPRLDNAAFSGRPDKWKQVPIDAVGAKIETLKSSGRKIRWAFFAQPTEDIPYKDTDLKVRFCKSVRAMMRHAMERRKTFLATNALSLSLACAGCVWGTQYYWPTPHIASVIGVDSAIDAAKLVSGIPLRVRSGRPISVQMDTDRSAKDTELIVRSARVGPDGKRRNVLLASQVGVRVSEIRCGFVGNRTTFAYVIDDQDLRDDVLEIGVWHANRLTAWYPLYLSIVNTGAER